MRVPSLSTQVVEVSVRSDSASTRLPESLAAIRAEGRSAAVPAALALTFGCWGRAGSVAGVARAGWVPASSATATAVATVPLSARRTAGDLRGVPPGMA